MVCWSASTLAAECYRLQKCWISFWNFRWQSNRKSSCQPHTWLLSGWPLCKNCEVSKPDLEAVILVWTSLISMFSASARVFAANELNFISNISLNLVIFEFEPYNSRIWTLQHFELLWYNHWNGIVWDSYIASTILTLICNGLRFYYPFSNQFTLSISEHTICIANSIAIFNIIAHSWFLPPCAV